MKRALLFAFALLFAGLLCVVQQPRAQVPTTGAGRFGPSGPPAVTWDPLHVANITLSGGNLVATNNNSGPGTAITQIGAAGSKKYYFEIVLTNDTDGGGQNTGIGLSNSCCGYGGGFLGGSSASIGCYDSANTFYNGGNVGTCTPGAWSQGDNIGVAYDTGNGKAWFRQNGGNWNNAAIGSQNPATNTGGFSISISGTVYPAVQIRQSVIDTMTAKFLASSWTYTVPSGFVAVGL
jgi:hypothetical protein